MAEETIDQETIEEDELTNEELAQICEQRANTYAFIARLYRKEIDKDLLLQMRAQRYPAESGNDDVDEGYHRIARYLSNLWENSVDDLAVDYSRAFVGHGNNAYSAAYPYESVYTSPKRLLMQNARDEVLAVYRSEHLDKAETWREAEDHISAELEFMQIMAERAAKALRKGDDTNIEHLFNTQRNFLDDHLYAWAGMMTKDLRKFAKTDMYKGLACLTDGFLALDHEFLKGLAEINADEAGDKGENGEAKNAERA